MRLQQLQYFVAVAEHRSFTKAAEHLYVAQPSVSQQLQRLEAELGVQLLDRSQRAVVPTEIGSKLLSRARTILSEIADMSREAIDYSGLAFGTLRIGTVPSASRVLLPRALPWFTAEYPEVELEIQEAGSLDIADLVREGELDLGLIVCPFDDPGRFEGFRLTPLATGELAACLPSTNPLSRRSQVRLDQLRDEPFIQFRKGYLVQQILAEAAEWDISRNIVYSTDNTDSARSMVSAGVGITFVSIFSEEILRNQDDIRLVPLHRPQLRVNLSAISYGDRYVPQAATAFLEGVERIAGSNRKPGLRGTHQLTAPDTT